MGFSLGQNKPEKIPSSCLDSTDISSPKDKYPAELSRVPIMRDLGSSVKAGVLAPLVTRLSALA
jgi:hypothetical protein